MRTPRTYGPLVEILEPTVQDLYWLQHFIDRTDYGTVTAEILLDLVLEGVYQLWRMEAPGLEGILLTQVFEYRTGLNEISIEGTGGKGLFTNWQVIEDGVKSYGKERGCTIIGGNCRWGTQEFYEQQGYKYFTARLLKEI